MLFAMAERLLMGRESALDEALAARQRALPPEATFERWSTRIRALRASLRADARSAGIPTSSPV